ncbi:MAG: DUF3087 domain-containing protein [gamma proteobacterium symbiont of Bathyaustriella thionipta]|nr:DUF3087 domain-containing protein [gamma proteobacterium symbiont of Bathyaustriella thionipta]
MRLKEIDKTRYRKHLKVVFAGIVVALLLITISASTLFIQLFSTPQVSHFWHNLAGVAVAATVVVFILNKLRSHPYMSEVVYVWDLKQQLNKIYRKQRKIEARVEQGDHDAMIIMNFQNKGSKQLYLLDDNTITIDELRIKIQQLDERMQAAGLSLSTDSFDPAMLDKF